MSQASEALRNAMALRARNYFSHKPDEHRWSVATLTCMTCGITIRDFEKSGLSIECVPQIGYRPPSHDGGEKMRQLREAYAADADRLAMEAWASHYARMFDDISTPIPAIRGWNLTSNCRLTSIAHSGGGPDEWEGPTSRTTAQLFGTSGFYAVKPASINLLRTYKPSVLGVVELIGNVIEHTEIYRADQCTILELFVISANAADYVPRTKPSILQEGLSLRYDCDVSTYETWDDLMLTLQERSAKP